MKNARFATFHLCIMLALCVALPARAAEPWEKVTPENVLDTLDASRPRLMLKDADLERLKKRAEKDLTLAKYVRDALGDADSALRRSPLEHKLQGPRLLDVSRDCLGRVYALGLAWRWTGDKKYAEKAKENLLTVCAFPDWNPSHFLDTAEMSHAVGVGYDWLYSYLDEESREKIRAGLIENGMLPGVKAYQEDRPAWWTRSAFNWNQVCNAGLMVGALAIADTDPQYARQIVPAAVRSMPAALRSYAPDGAWGEGPGYWSYATHYTAFGFTALETALGSDFGLSTIEGLGVTGHFPNNAAGPTGLYLNYADAGENSRRRPMACMFYLARKYDDAVLSDAEHAVIAQSRSGGADANHVMWYVPRSDAESPPDRPLDIHVRGMADIALTRSAWDDPDALFVGAKSGYNQINHGHMDLGNFELSALGVRWARDLGSDDYNMPGYWDSKTGGRRWDYFRLNTFSHNVPFLDGKNQNAMGKSSFLRVQDGEGAVAPFAILDLTSVYTPASKKTWRGISLVERRRAALIQDEFDLDGAHQATWGMTTDADIKIAPDGRSAELSLKGKQLIATILSPTDAKFAVESAEQKQPEKSNRGVKRLLARAGKTEGEVRIAVLLAPVWKDGGAVKEVHIQPLAEW